MAKRPDVTLTQLRYLVSAATHGTMTAAAAEMHVAQSAVSAAVAELERQVGTQLFIRQRARGLVLTAAGEEFVSEARAVLAHLDEVLGNARGRSEQVRGHIRFLDKHRGRREAERARRLLLVSLRLRGWVFAGQRGRTYADTARWLAGSSVKELLAG